MSRIDDLLVNADERPAEPRPNSNGDRSMDSGLQQQFKKWRDALKSFPQATNAEQIFDRLKMRVSEVSRGQSFVLDDVEGDPGRILLETYAVLHATIASHVVEQIDGLVGNVLQVAGHAPLSRQPAVTVMGIEGPTGERVKCDEATAIPGKCPRGEDPSQFAFRPIADILLWKAAPIGLAMASDSKDKASQRHTVWWRVEIPEERGENDDLVAWFAASGSEFDLDEGTWRFIEDGKSISSVKVARDFAFTIHPTAIWTVTHRTSPEDWLRLTIGKSNDNIDEWKDDLAEIERQWANSQKIAEVAGNVRRNLALNTAYERRLQTWVKNAGDKIAKDPAMGCRGWLVWEANQDAKSEEPKMTMQRVAESLLVAAAVPWINGPLDPDSVVEKEVIPCAGAAANLVGDESWKATVNVVPEVKLTSLVPIESGTNAESFDAFLQRAPRALRHRGIASTSRDWEEIVSQVDPRNRIAHCIAREGFIQFPEGGWGQGVQIAFHCRGPIQQAARLAKNLKPAISRTLDLVRPLGVGYEVIAPTLVPGKLRLNLHPRDPRAVPRGVLEKVKSAISELLSLAIEEADDSSFWLFLRKQFRGHGRTSDCESLVRAHLEQSEQRIIWPTRLEGWGEPEAIQFKPSLLPDRNEWLVPFITSVNDIEFSFE